MGEVYYQHQKYDEALAEYRKGQNMLEATVGPTHPEVASVCNNTGLALYQKGEYDDALAQPQKAYQIMARKYGDNLPSLSAAPLGWIGNELQLKKNLEETFIQYRKAYQMLEATLGQSHQNAHSSYNNMDHVCEGRGMFISTGLVYKTTETLGGLCLLMGSYHFNSGLVLRKMVNAAAAMAEFQTARDIWAKADSGPEHTNTTTTTESGREIPQERATRARAI
jgi:tetratricopeptide (TPR) repeat protein